MSSNKTVLITGGTSGIGAATARALVSRGHRVVVTGRDKQKLDAFVEQTGAPANLLAIAANASDWEDTRAVVEQTVTHFGGLDAAVANAGFSSADYQKGMNVFEDHGDPSLWPDMVLTNVLGPALLAKAALPHLETSRGRLVLVGSVVGVKNSPGNLYSATKWAVTGLAENLRMYATTRGVGVTLINPGIVATSFWRDKVPSGALSPTPVADAICYALDQPAGVDVNTITVRPIGQPN